MKRGTLITIGVVVFLLLLGGCQYNGLVGQEEDVNGKWAQVQTQYQRRSDLIGNLVETVKGAANFERETLTQVVKARSQATQINLNADDLTPENVQRFQQVQDGLSSALSRLLVTVERYPELKANQNFLELQAQLEGTENRIAVARQDFNQSVQGYNSSVRRFPASLFAGVFGFDRKSYFESQPGSERAPSVKF